MTTTIGIAVLVLAGAATVGIGRAQTPWQAAWVAVEARASGVPSPAGGDTVTTRRLWSLGSRRWLMPGGQSPDGRYVAYTDWATGDLAVHDVVSQTDRRLTDKGSWTQNGAEFAEGATFSPDGQRIAYAWSNSESRPELRVVGLDGGAPRIVYRHEEMAGLQPFAWSPDGRSVLALLSRRDGGNQVATISVADGTVRILKSFNRGSPSGLTYSPDGRWVLYDFPPSEDGPQRDVFVLAADGSREVPLVQSPADDRVLGWAPDGRHVLFLSDRAGTRGAWMISVAAGRPQGDPVLVKPDLWRSEPVGFTRDGKLYYTVTTGTSGVYIATVDPASGRVAVPPTLVSRQAAWPVFSPDGRSLAYIVRSPSPQPFALRIRSLESGEERTLEPRLRSFMFPRWSPDGRAMVGRGADDQNRPGLYTLDMQTGAVSRVLALDAPNSGAQFPVWSRDAQTIFFVYFTGTSPLSSLRALNVQTGETRELYRSGVRAFVGNEMTPSPDGAELAWVRGDTVTQVSELMAMPTAGGDPRVLATLRPGEEPRPVAWTRDGLFYEVHTYPTAGPARPVQLWLLPAGGSPVRFDLGAEGGHLPWFGVHPDGRRVTYLSGDIGSELWVMENILPGLGTARPSSPRR